MFIRNNYLVVDNFDTPYDLFVAHPSNNRLSSRTRQKNSKYFLSNEISNGITIFKPIGFDIYGELGHETIKFIVSIVSYASTFKCLKPSYFTNRFYNILSFFFANENSNINIFLNMVNLESGILLILYYNFNVLMMWYF
jgi:hypothetical protein